MPASPKNASRWVFSIARAPRKDWLSVVRAIRRRPGKRCLLKLDRAVEVARRPARLIAPVQRAPEIVELKRLTDLPMLWSEQWGAIGLQAPAQVRAELR